MKVYVRDGHRYRLHTGYGVISRYLILGLAELGHEVFVEEGPRVWDELEEGARARLEKLPPTTACREPDLVLQVGSPRFAARTLDAPNLFYTMNALGDLPKAWSEQIRREVDGCVVPSDLDRRVFARYLEPVYVVRLSSNPGVFMPRPAWRAEGSPNFTFLFVGAYGYRKGLDLLLESFLTEFDQDEPVELWLHCSDMGDGDSFNHLLGYLQRLNPVAKVKLFNRPLSPASMCRMYNRADAIVTLSRGEGWCMPVTEAMLCAKPVIAPRSTAMGEYLDDRVAFLVPVEEERISEIGNPFGAGMAATYGKRGNVCYAPRVDAARKLMRLVYMHREEARRRAEAGHAYVRDVLTWEASARALESACADFVRRTTGVSLPEALPDRRMELPSTQRFDPAGVRLGRQLWPSVKPLVPRGVRERLFDRFGRNVSRG